MATIALWTFLSDMRVCAMRDACAGSRSADEPEARPQRRPTRLPVAPAGRNVQDCTRHPSNDFSQMKHSGGNSASSRLAKLPPDQQDLPGDFFHRLAALAVGDHRVVQRIQRQAWTEPRSLLEDRRAASRFRFMWQCIKMDHADPSHRESTHRIWRALDGYDQQAFLQAYSHGPVSQDFFINIVMPTKLTSAGQADAATSPTALSNFVVMQNSPARQAQGGQDDAMVAELESVRQASRAACLVEIASHLDMFVQRQPFASYEEWISELHPESTRNTDTWAGAGIDYRYYLEDSDHRVLWNAKVDVMHAVAPRGPDGEPLETTI